MILHSLQGYVCIERTGDRKRGGESRYLQLALGREALTGLKIVLLVERLDLSDHVRRSEPDRSTLVQGLGLKIEDALGASGSTATGLLDQEGHGVALIEETKLAAGVVGVRGVCKDATIENSTVNVGDHGANVTSTVLATTFLLYVFTCGGIPLGGVALVDGVDLTLARNAHVTVGENELADGGIQGEAMHTETSRHDDGGGGTVKRVASGKKLVAGTKEIAHGCGLGGLGVLLVNAPNATNTDVAVNVGRTIQGVEDNGITTLGVVNNNGTVLLLATNNVDFVRESAAVDKDIVGKHIELLLLITGRVLTASNAVKVGDTGLMSRASNNLHCKLNRLQEHSKVTSGVGELLLLLKEETSQRNGVAVTLKLKVLWRSRSSTRCRSS